MEEGIASTPGRPLKEGRSGSNNLCMRRISVYMYFPVKSTINYLLKIYGEHTIPGF